MPSGSSHQATARGSREKRGDLRLQSTVSNLKSSPPSEQSSLDHVVRPKSESSHRFPLAASRPAELRRRALNAEHAAIYFDVSESTFLKWVKQGIMPKPVRVDGCVRWCVRQLDAGFDHLCSQHENENEWDGVFQ